MEQFIMNNCKIANELRKYRDLTGCVNRAGLSDDPENYVEYVITREMSYMDMVTANAVYSLWRSGEGDNGFRAETIGQIMAGDMARRLRPEKQDEIEERLQKLAGTELYILADHDQQAMQEVYEGAFLPLTWETGRSRLRFRFKDGGQMPLYQYAEERNQLIRIPVSLLRDDEALGQTRLKAGSRTFSIPLNRQDLADFLFVDRSAMSNELCKMRDEGLVKFEKSNFELLIEMPITEEERDPNQ